jgi:hypothetical protein
MKNRQSILIPIIIFISIHTASAQNWLWAFGFTSSLCNGDNGQYVLVPPNGNVYCLGSYGGNCTITAGNQTLSAGGTANGFFASFSQNGNMLNISNLAAPYGNGHQYYDVGFSDKPAIDDSGLIYTCIEANGPCTIDTINAGEIGIQSSMLAHWNNNDRCLWVKYLPGLFNAVYSNGGLYAMGRYEQDSVIIDSITLHGSANKTTSYLSNLTLSGNCKWVKQASGGNTIFNCIQTGNNHIYLYAQTDSCFIYDTVSLCGQNGAGLGLLMQTDTNGNVQWTSTFSNSIVNGLSKSLSVDASGNSYMVGSFDTTLYLGNDTLYKTNIETYDGFIAKYDTLGNILWVRQVYSFGQTYFYSITTDAAGYSYVLGSLNGMAIFGTDTISTQTQTTFLTRYTPSGRHMQVLSLPGPVAFDMAVDTDNNIYLTGQINGSVSFGNTTLTGNTTFGDFFVAKISGITDSTTNVSSLAPCDNTLQIFANPNAGIFTITVPQCIIHASTGNFTVYDYQGSVIKNETVNLSTSKIEVDLGVVTRGVYNVLLTANGMQFTGRVVVQ